jgi:hypothetical protein
MDCNWPECECQDANGAPWCKALFPYRHAGPPVYGSKFVDYLITEANMRENGLLPEDDSLEFTDGR